MLIKKNHNQESSKKANQIKENQETQNIEQNLNLDEVVFTERKERRRGDRRRGYRRIDERNLISRAHQEAIAIKEEAQKEGYDNGLQEAQHDIQQLTMALEQFFDTKTQVYQELAPEILEISVEVAKKIIKKEIEINRNILINTVIEALDGISRNEKKITIRVSPEDFEIAQNSIPEIMSTTQTEAKIVVVSDDKIIEGGALIETSNGIIDATFETQLRILEEAFKKII